MGVRPVESREYTCDSCGVSAVLTLGRHEDPKGWKVLSKTVYCGSHYCTGHNEVETYCKDCKNDS